MVLKNIQVNKSYKSFLNCVVTQFISISNSNSYGKASNTGRMKILFMGYQMFSIGYILLHAVNNGTHVIYCVY